MSNVMTSEAALLRALQILKPDLDPQPLLEKHRTIEQTTG